MTAEPSTPTSLSDALHDLFGYSDFRPGQLPVIEAVLAGEDVLAIMPTGAGKSLCYQLPAFLLPGCTVVISPLVALMKDQLDSLPDALRARAAIFNSTIERDAMDVGLAALAAGELKLVYVAPERLRQRPFLHTLARARISRLVVDEAHCISLWGHDFRPDYLFIPAILELIGRPPVLAMTATATPAVQDELQTRFGRPLTRVHTGVLRPNLYLEVQRVKDKEEKLTRLLEVCKEERGAGIVYVSSRDNAEFLARFLRQRRPEEGGLEFGISARHYHAGLDNAERAAVQDAFMSGKVRVIVATVAFGMGVDKADVRFIVHFNPSRSLEAYAQESGRAGRDGKDARCILFWATSDKTALSRWAREDMLTPPLLSAVYRALRRGQRGNYTWRQADMLVREVTQAGVKDVDETTVRVAIGALERVGVVRRHCDLPETAQIRIPPHAALSPELTAALGVPGPGRYARDFFDLAERFDHPPESVEETLLTLQDEETLDYYGAGRGLLIELLPHPADLAERLRALLDGYDTSQQERVREIEGYAVRPKCRTAVIAHHFGVDHPGRCDHCDVCLGAVQPVEGRAASRAAREEAPAAEPERAPEDLIIESIAELPFPMGRTGVGRLLKGSVSSAVKADRSRHFGALAALTTAAIEREVDRLVDAGFLYRDDGEYRLLSVTPAGYEKPPAPWPPPRPQSLSRRAAPRPPRESSGPAQDAAAEQEDDAVVEERFERLKEWRREQVRGTTLPFYTVLNDDTLRRLAARRIASLADLEQVKGIGPAKLTKYGADLLELLAEDADG